MQVYILHSKPIRSLDARRSIFPLMKRLNIIKTGEQHIVETSHILVIGRLHSIHSLVKVLVPVVFIFELTNAVLNGVSSD